MQPRGLGRRNMFKVFQLFASLVLLWCLSGLALTQDKPSAEDQAKLDQAQKEAARFVERFRRTLDFATVWREFHSSDTTCAIRTTPSLPGFTGGELKEKPLDQRLKEMGLDDRLLTRLYVATWNSSLLIGTYLYTIAPSKSGSEPAIEGPFEHKYVTYGMKRIFKEMKRWDPDDGLKQSPHTAKDFEKIIVNLNRFSALLRKYMPHNALKTGNWRSAVKWYDDVHNFKGVRQPDPNRDLCVEREGPLYFAQIGHFGFGFIEEKGRMKLLTMILVSE